MSPCVLMTSVFFILVSQSSAGGGFLEGPMVTRAELESRLLSELAAVAAPGATYGTRVGGLEATLKPMYDAAPQEADGTINHAVVRYVLHRFFAKHRRWFIRGLEPTGTPTNETSGKQDVQEWVPDYLQSFLENMMGKSGLSLKELAVFAATLEDFVISEERGWLKQVYKLLWHPVDGRLGKTEVKELLQTYLMLYNLDGNVPSSTPQMMKAMLARFATKAKSWEETVAWLGELQSSFWGPDASRQMDFEETLRLVQAVGEHYGEFNDGECLKMKKQLLTVESRKQGRVRLTDFYKMALYETWEFNEKIEYLRSLGTLDESDPTTPMVIVPNYVASRPQCLIASNYYAVCCRNECEDLLGSMESSIKAPQANVEEIAKLVETLQSSTVAAPRKLSKSLLGRLEDVATINHGKVPLHGRLFAQWMHHAFPRECPYPHVGGTVNPQTADEWMKETGQQDSKATNEEMISRVKSENCKFTPIGMECAHHKQRLLSRPQHDNSHVELPWSHVEELLVVRASVAPRSRTTKFYARDLLVYIALFSVVSFLLWISRPLLASWLPLSSSKKNVRCRI